MPSRVRLGDLIRQKISQAQLPRETPLKVWAGYGTSETCSACDGIIRPAQVEYSFRIQNQPFRFHAGCYGLWYAERSRRGYVAPTNGTEERADMTCIDCLAGIANISVDQVARGLPQSVSDITVTSTFGRCPRCGRLALVLKGLS